MKEENWIKDYKAYFEANVLDGDDVRGEANMVAPFFAFDASCNFIRDLLTAQKEKIKGVVVKERLRAFEILHKYAMTTKDTAALDLIEAAQQEVLESPDLLTKIDEV